MNNQPKCAQVKTATPMEEATERLMVQTHRLEVTIGTMGETLQVEGTQPGPVLKEQISLLTPRDYIDQATRRIEEACTYLGTLCELVRNELGEMKIFR